MSICFEPSRRQPYTIYVPRPPIYHTRRVMQLNGRELVVSQQTINQIGKLSGFTSLAYDVFLQIRSGNTLETIRFIENNCWDVNSHLNNYQWTALHLAAYQGDYDLVEFLLRQGANPGLVNTSGYTPMMLAEYKGNTNLLGILKGDAELVQMASSSSCCLVTFVIPTKSYVYMKYDDNSVCLAEQIALKPLKSTI